MTPRTRLLLILAAVAAVLAPVAAVAAGGAARDIVLDFQQPGPMRDLLGKSLGVAKGFLFLAAFLGYALEAFGRSPTADRDYGVVTWRVVAVLFLLWNYQPIFGSVINLMDRIEREVAPPSTWEQLRIAVARNQTALADLSAQGEAPQPAGAKGEPASTPVRRPSTLTSWVYEAFVTILQLLGEGLVFLIRWMSKILTATLFILGPLALVAGIPRVSNTGARWFHRFVTIASWPIFAGVLLAVMVALGGQGAQYRSYLECLVASLVMLVTALSTPTLASQVVGGALQNFAATGFGAAKSAHREGLVPAARVAGALAGGVKGAVVAAARAVGWHSEGEGSGGARGGSGGRGPGGARGGGQGGVVANSPDGSPRGARGARSRGQGGAGNSSRGGATTPARPGGGSAGPQQGGVVANPPAPSAPQPGGPGRGIPRGSGGNGSGAR